MSRRSRTTRRAAQPIESRAARPGPSGGSGSAAADLRLPSGAQYRPIDQQYAYQQALQPQYGMPFNGRTPGSQLYGDNSTPVSAYQQDPRLPVPQGGGIFPPGDPIRPIPGLGVRQWQYPVGSNITPTPRHTEDISFDTLRALARAYYAIGLCEDAYFRILRRLELEIVPDRHLLGEDDNPADNKWRDAGMRMKEWFESGPDKRGDDLKQWMIAVERDLLQIDACGIYPEPTRSGTLYALSYVAGDTIKCLGDLSGRVPRPPAPAYQQIYSGAPGILLQRATPRVTGDQLDYLKLKSRTNSLYGESPLDRMVVIVNQALRKGSYDLSRFTRGATPEGVVETDNPQLFNLTPDQVLSYQDMWNAVLQGNDALRNSTRFLQPGFHFTNTRQPEIATEFDEFLFRIALAMYGFTRDEVGWTDTSNRSTGASQENVTYRNAVKPSASYFSDYFTRVIRRYDGQPLSVVGATISVPGRPTVSKLGVWDRRYVAKWTGIEEPDDWNRKASSYVQLVNNGIVGRTDAKRALGIPVAVNEEPIPAMITAAGGAQSVVVLEDLLKNRSKMSDAHSATLDASIASSKQVKSAMEQQQQMGAAGMQGGAPGAPGAAPMNPIALQAMAAGKPEAAQQAASGGVPAGGQQAQQPPQSTAQKAAAQQVGAKLAAAAKRYGAADDATDAEMGEDEQGEDRVQHASRGPAYGDADDRTGAAAGWDMAATGFDGLGATDRDRGHPDERASATSASTARATADGSSSAGGRDERRGERGSSRGHAPDGSDTRAPETDSTRSSEDRSETNSEARSEDWRRWRERSLKAVKQGRSAPAFTSEYIEPTLHRAVSERLARCTTADEVRAVFTEARAQEGGTADRKRDADTAADTQHTGIMVAVFVPARAARVLAVPGYEPADDLHITLAYLGDAAAYSSARLRTMQKMLTAWAAEQPPLHVTVTGVSRFPADPATGIYPLYAAVDIPGIQAWRASLVKRLNAEGFPVDMTHPQYTPHITLAYVAPDHQGAAPVAHVPHIAFDCDRLWIAAGDLRFSMPIGDEAYPEGTRATASDTQPAQSLTAADDPLQRLADALVARLEQSSNAATQATLRDLRTAVLDRL